MTTVILQTTARMLSPLMVVLSGYLLLRGHNSPGGGFAAGLVAGLMIVLRSFAYGPDSMRFLLGLEAGALVGAGLLLTVGTGLGGLLWGTTFLEAALWHTELPVIGMLELSTAMLFEVGIFAVVISVSVAVVQELGGQ